MIDFIYASMVYVSGNVYFWPSMAFTVIIGMFVSASIYDGELEQIKKFWIALGAYIGLVFLTTTARLLPLLPNFRVDQRFMPFASMTTITLITFFYLIGMTLGISIVHHAHKTNKKRKGGVKKWTLRNMRLLLPR